ncbi:MAG: hypothetical protein J5825_01225 [Lachnospiraceae bacterium]|nr:hypothetical protein [Lachnospiraceae bacterium]
MDKKLASILAYCTWIGWLVAFLAPGEDVKANPGYKQHLNQGLILFIICFIPIGITQLFALIFAVMGIIRAAQDNDEPLPLIGGVKIIK